MVLTRGEFWYRQSVRRLMAQLICPITTLNLNMQAWTTLTMKGLMLRTAWYTRWECAEFGLDMLYANWQDFWGCQESCGSGYSFRGPVVSEILQVLCRLCLVTRYFDPTMNWFIVGIRCRSDHASLGYAYKWPIVRVTCRCCIIGDAYSWPTIEACRIDSPSLGSSRKLVPAFICLVVYIQQWVAYM